MRETAGIRWMCWLPLVAAVVLPVAEGRVDCTCHVRAQTRSVVHISCPDVQNGSAVGSCVTEKLDGGQPARRYVSEEFQFVAPRSLVKVSRASLAWHKARSVCKAHGGDLFVPLDEEIVKLLSRELYSQQYFIGLTDVRSEGIFMDLEGHPAHYLNWNADEPNNLGDGENCVTLNREGKMNDLTCDLATPFLCEIRMRTAPPAGFSLSAAAGSFLRLSGDALSHAGAAGTCASQGARLFVPDTAARVEALLHHVPVDVGDMLVGLSDALTEGLFVTDTGERQSDMDFSGWLPGQPDDGAGAAGAVGEDCVALHSHGFLADVSCEQPRRYVCEWLP